MKAFSERLLAACGERESVVCLGLDPRFELLPAEIRREAGDEPRLQARAFRRFCEAVIDLAVPYAPVVKPQAAFFEALGPPGFEALCEVCAHARKRGMLVIADVKRGDIGTTAEAYASAWLAAAPARPALADACTVNPYLGSDGVVPFVQAAATSGGMVFVLVKTSNPSSAEVQDLPMADGRRLVDRVADLVASWNAPVGPSGYGPVGAVVGATHPKDLATFRAKLAQSVLLIPGYGAQGAAAKDVVAGFDRRGAGAVVNASRSLTFPWGKPERCPDAWQDAVVAALAAMKRDLNEALASARR